MSSKEGYIQSYDDTDSSVFHEGIFPFCIPLNKGNLKRPTSSTDPDEIHLLHSKRSRLETSSNSSENENEASDLDDNLNVIEDESEHSESENRVVSRWNVNFQKSWPWLMYNVQTDTATCRYRNCRMYSPPPSFMICL